MFDLSIIIVSYNTKTVLANCLKSLQEFIQSITYEVIVIDNQSQDGSVEMLKKDFPQVRVIANIDNVGFSCANNQGIAAAKGRYFLVLNSDTLLFDDGFKKILMYMDQHQEVGVLGCKILNQDRSLQNSCWHRPSVLSELLLFAKTIIKNVWDPITYYKDMRYWDHNTRREVDCLSGCFLWIRREVIEAVGALDEDFFMYYEDFEFCYRVKTKSDFKLLYFPDTSIVHLGQMSANPQTYSMIKSCVESVQTYFIKCDGESRAKRFRFFCQLIWQFEKIFFYLLRFHPKCLKKYEMLKALTS